MPGKPLMSCRSAPALRGLGRLAGAAVVAERLADRDRVAGHDAGGNRAELARDGRGGGLVAERHPFVRPAEGDERAALVMKGDRLQVGVAVVDGELHTRRGRARGPVPAQGAVPAAQAKDVRPRRCVGLLLDEALSALEPAVADRLLQELEVVGRGSRPRGAPPRRASTPRRSTRANARPRASMQTSICPSHHAAPASRSRSAASRPPSRSSSR